MEIDSATPYAQKVVGDGFGDSDDEVITDPEFLQSVLQTLPGVDPQSEAVQQAMNELTQQRSSSSDKSNEKKSKKEGS